MLGCCPFRRRNRCHRLNTLALARHHQAQAIISKWLGPVGMPDHARQTLNISRKPRFSTARSWQTHSSLPSLKYESCQIDDSPPRQPRLSDSVRLEQWYIGPKPGQHYGWNWGKKPIYLLEL